MTDKEKQEFDALVKRVTENERQITLLQDRNKVMDERILETLQDATRRRAI